MEKLQILFPEPQLRRLRRIAKKQDRPMSELIRAAVDAWMEHYSPEDQVAEEDPPVYCCGTVLAQPENLREMAQSDRMSG